MSARWPLFTLVKVYCTIVLCSLIGREILANPTPFAAVLPNDSGGDTRRAEATMPFVLLLVLLIGGSVLITLLLDVLERRWDRKLGT